MIKENVKSTVAVDQNLNVLKNNPKKISKQTIEIKKYIKDNSAAYSTLIRGLQKERAKLE